MPVKSLIRFTSVCRSWFSLIKSPEFVAKHYATRNDSLQQNDCHFLVAYSSYSDPIAKFLSYETLEISSVFECKPFDSSSDPLFAISWRFFGSCNGIFCVEVQKFKNVIILWNSATREVFVPNQPRGVLNFVGFGFDDKANDYKIVMFDYNGIVELYSLRSDSWTSVEADFSFGEDKDIFEQIDPTSNGSMYTWMVYDSLCNGLCLLSFDMIDEVFVETPMPDGIKGCYLCFMQQRCNQSFPALLSFDLVNCSSRAESIDVWVLNEYGPSGYWTKELSLAWPEHVILGAPRGLWKNEGVLFIGQERVLTCYNTVTQEMRLLQVPGQQLLGYTESLISIKDLCLPEKLEGRSDRMGFQQAREVESSESDEDDEDQDIYEIPYYICEINQPVLSNPVTF